MYEMNAREYSEKTAKGLFRKVYPLLASQVLARTGIHSGLCLDLGGGPGLFGIELAYITELDVVIYDLLPDCVTVARENAAERGLSERVSARVGRAEAIDYPSNAVDLVISRGSIFFWEDQKQGLAEIYRVLRPGGWAYVGGGFGSMEILAEVLAEKAHDPSWDENRRCRMQKNPPEHFQRLLTELGIPAFIETGPAGVWIIFQKLPA